MVRCIFLVFFMVITTISSYGQNEEQKMMGEAKLKEESLLTRDTLSYALNDVVIKGSAKSMRITDNSVIMNIANTELAKKGKLLDILTYMPFVSKQNNNIIVAGKGEPIFYLNGHRLYESSELEKLLASDIKDIEVVTSPGAEYDASAKAVIKIRTIKPKGVGFSGNVESTFAYLGNHKLSEIPRSNFNYRTGGLDVFASLNLRETRTKSESSQNMSLTNEDTYAQNETSVTRNTWLGYDGNIGMDYTAKSWNFGIKYAFTKTPYNKATTEGDVQVMKNEETFYDLWLKNATDINMLVQNLSAYAIYDLSKHSKLFMDWYFDANDVIFYWEKNRPSQIREMSDLAPAVTRIRDSNEFINAVSIKERVAACLAVFIRRANPVNGIGRQARGSGPEISYDGMTLTPGMIGELNPGDQLDVVNPASSGEDSAAFLKVQQRMIASGQGLSYEAVSRDMSETNYSSARQAIIEDENTYYNETDIIIERVMDEVYETFVISCVLTGKVNIPDFWADKLRYLKHTWVASPKKWIDPSKEATANKIALETGQKSWVDICAESGKDWKEQIDNMAKANEYAQLKGVEIGGILNGKKQSENAEAATAANGN